MGKKGEKTHLGRTLIKNRFGNNDCQKSRNSFLHTVDMQDGYDWGLMNLQSITEESSFQEFLNTAQLAGTEFQAEKQNVKFVNAKNKIDLLSSASFEKLMKAQDQNKKFLKIPRKPKWNELMTANELKMKEQEEYLEWRKKLTILQETQGLSLTPYEKNLEFWRQLWRVVERSDIVVQIVDARNPLLFRCEDLEYYVKELDANKINIILINKADFLTLQQRKIWADYFSKLNIQVVFFSAKLVTEECSTNSINLKKDLQIDDTLDPISETDCPKDIESETINSRFSDVTITDVDNIKSSENELDSKNNFTLASAIVNSPNLVCREKLISFLKNMGKAQNRVNDFLTIGLVGYPNVGKSSTINALLMNKRVPVSDTPGKTKHFQTIYLEKNVVLCDCPGIVMPNFINSKADMILNGILPINQLKDHNSSISLLTSLIPRHVIEDFYGIMLPQPSEGEDLNRFPTAEELLNIHGFNRGFMTQNGQPDNARSARCILKDFVCGKLLYCVAPPKCNQSEYHTFSVKKGLKKIYSLQNSRAVKVTRILKPTTEDIDTDFFQDNTTGVHIRGNINAPQLQRLNKLDTRT